MGVFQQVQHGASHAWGQVESGWRHSWDQVKSVDDIRKSLDSIAKHIGYLPFPLPTKRALEFILSRWADLLLAVSIALEPGGLVVLALLLVYYAYLEGQAFGRFRRIPQPLRDILKPYYHPVDLDHVRIAERIDVPQGEP